MKVSISWLKELVDLNCSVEELINLMTLRSVSIKEVTPDSIELDMKGYNRADLLFLRGVAREVAAITNSSVKFTEQPALNYNLPEIPVKVVNKEICPVYCVAKIENLKVEQSSDTWVKKLSDSGIRAVNNIADVTNLIMLEYGQPLHAFDGRGVKDETIIVRTAKKGEKITTLDGKTRDLDPEDLLIADPLNTLGIAGVMGGKDSKVSESTTTILLEAAIFDPVSIRKTSQRQGLSSEASKRFQHGLTKTNLLQALSGAIKMCEDLGGKLTAISLVGDLTDEPKTIQLTQQKINSLIGVEIPADKVESSLKSLGFKVAGNQITVPFWRLDINIEEDLIEEVARMYGYEKIPPKKLEKTLPAGRQVDQTLPNFIYDLKVKLKDLGLTEVQTYSFYSTAVLEALGFTTDNLKTLVKVANPISSETEYLRMDLWPNLLEVIGKNLKQGYKDIAVFEIGKTYSPKVRGLPNEGYRLSIALMNGTDNPIEELSVIANAVKQSAKSDPRNDEWFHPARTTSNMAEVHLRVLNKLGIEKRIAVLEIEVS